MNIFLDTSSLFKLYHKETGTDEIIDLFTKLHIQSIFLAEITKIEFASALWKKCRKGNIPEEIVRELILKFDRDSSKFTFIPEDQQLRLNARNLIQKHWIEGLRTLDSLQLSSVLYVKNQTDLFITSDNVLKKIAEKEELPCF